MGIKPIDSGLGIDKKTADGKLPNDESEATPRDPITGAPTRITDNFTGADVSQRLSDLHARQSERWAQVDAKLDARGESKTVLGLEASDRATGSRIINRELGHHPVTLVFLKNRKASPEVTMPLTKPALRNCTQRIPTSGWMSTRLRSGRVANHNDSASLRRRLQSVGVACGV